MQMDRFGNVLDVSIALSLWHITDYAIALGQMVELKDNKFLGVAMLVMKLY
jgi:hypothetical protein